MAQVTGEAHLCPGRRRTMAAPAGGDYGNTRWRRGTPVPTAPAPAEAEQWGGTMKEGTDEWLVDG